MQWYASIDLDSHLRPPSNSTYAYKRICGREKKFPKESVGMDSKWVKYEGKKVSFNDNNIFFAINFSYMSL